jgi:hypothetical protein
VHHADKRILSNAVAARTGGQQRANEDGHQEPVAAVRPVEVRTGELLKQLTLQNYSTTPQGQIDQNQMNAEQNYVVYSYENY